MLELFAKVLLREVPVARGEIPEMLYSVIEEPLHRPRCSFQVSGQQLWLTDILYKVLVGYSVRMAAV